MNKYKNEICKVNGIGFDSKMEADYYRYLLDQKQAGKVLQISLQPKLVLQKGFRLNGEAYRPITYTPDFLIEYDNGSKAYVDVKGKDTHEGKLKYKLYKYLFEHEQNGIPLQWVAKSLKYSTTGWIDWFELQRLRRKNKGR